MRAVAALDSLIAARADPRPLALLRIVVGLNAVLCGFEEWLNLRQILHPDGFRLPYFAGMPSLPLTALPWFMAGWFLAAAFLCIGWFTRTAGTLLAALMIYVLVLDQQTYSNHLYLLILEVFFLVVGNSGAVSAVDARGQAEPRLVPAWPITLWKLQISIMYFYAAVAKLNKEFLEGEVLAMFWPTTGALGFLASWRTPQLLQPLAWLSVALEFFLAGALWLRGLRKLALFLGISLHLGMVLMVSQENPLGIIEFALATLPPYLLFFEWTNGTKPPRESA